MALSRASEAAQEVKLVLQKTQEPRFELLETWRESHMHYWLSVTPELLQDRTEMGDSPDG